MRFFVPRWTLALTGDSVVAASAAHPPDRRGLLDDLRAELGVSAPFGVRVPARVLEGGPPDARG